MVEWGWKWSLQIVTKGSINVKLNVRNGWAFPIRIIITITIIITIIVIIIIIIMIIIIITIIKSDSNINWFFSRKINIKIKTI